MSKVKELPSDLIEIKALEGAKHMKEGQVYKVGRETAEILVKRKWAKKV